MGLRAQDWVDHEPCEMEGDVVEISSDDDLVEMSVAASPEPSSVSVFTPTKRQPSPTSSRCGIVNPIMLCMLCYCSASFSFQSTPQKENLNEAAETTFGVDESV